MKYVSLEQEETKDSQEVNKMNSKKAPKPYKEFIKADQINQYIEYSNKSLVTLWYQLFG